MLLSGAQSKLPIPIWLCSQVHMKGMQPSEERDLDCMLGSLGPNAGSILIRCMSLNKSLISCFVSFGAKNERECTNFTWTTLTDCMDVDCLILVLAAVKAVWVEVGCLSRRLNRRPKHSCNLPSCHFSVPGAFLSLFCSYVPHCTSRRRWRSKQAHRLEAESVALSTGPT